MPRKTILAALACIAVAAPAGAATFAASGAAREPAFSIELDGEAITQAYPVDARYLRHGRLDDPEMRFFSAGAPSGAPEPATASASS
ncbi:MAG: hypothetical protein ACKOTA_09160 [Solirubrobacterales bacterium]